MLRPHSESTQIFVETLTGKTVTLDVQQSSSIESAKQMTPHKVGVTSDQQRLMFGGALPRC